MVKWFGIALLPFVSALLIAGLVRLSWLPNFLYETTVLFDLAGLALRVGGLLSLCGVLAAMWLWWNDRRMQHALQQEQVVQSSIRRDFLRRLDHELKNPLTIIHLGVTNLRHDSTISSSQSESLVRIAQQTERLQKLIIDLRWLTELDEGSLEQVPVDLGDVLEEAIVLTKEGAKHAARQVTLNIQQTPWPLSPALGDRELLVVSFRNLLENSFKYTGDGDRIEIRAIENGQMAMIEVADSGRGIADHEQELIFDHLYRSQDARDMPGRGLGLSLVQQIITLHGGHIGVRSRPQAGTVFTVWLPLASSN